MERIIRLFTENRQSPYATRGYPAGSWYSARSRQRRFLHTSRYRQ